MLEHVLKTGREFVEERRRQDPLADPFPTNLKFFGNRSKARTFSQRRGPEATPAPLRFPGKSSKARGQFQRRGPFKVFAIRLSRSRSNAPAWESRRRGGSASPLGLRRRRCQHLQFFHLLTSPFHLLTSHSRFRRICPVFSSCSHAHFACGLPHLFGAGL